MGKLKTLGKLEWEQYDHNFNILTKKEIKEVKRKLEV